MKLTGIRLTLLVLTVLWQGIVLLQSRGADAFVQQLAWFVGWCMWTYVLLDAIEASVNGRPKTQAQASRAPQAAHAQGAGVQHPQVEEPVRRYPQTEDDLRALQGRSLD